MSKSHNALSRSFKTSSPVSPGLRFRRAACFGWLLTILCFVHCFAVNSIAIRSGADDVPNFALLDVLGQFHEFHRTPSKVVVLFFFENECPVARQYIQKLKHLRKDSNESDVMIWAVDSNPADSRESILKEAEKLGAVFSFPFLRDDNQGLASFLGVKRTATVVCISTKDGHVFYRGAVDDQVTEGATKSDAKNAFLVDALHQFLEGKPVAQPETEAHGCLFNFDAKIKGEGITYVHDVVPILEKHCIGCHSPGNIGPFVISSYEKVKSKGETIREVLLSRRMPPWSADPECGHFVGDRSMSADETRTLLGWIEKEYPRGEGPDPLLTYKFPEPVDWPLGKPDYIVKLPKPEQIPATGVVDYRHIRVKVPFPEDEWAGAVAVHPGNTKVLHHCIVRVKAPKNGEDDGSGRGVWLQGWAPGIAPVRFPEGTGRLIAKGSTLDVELHYTTMGIAQTDQTEIGFYKLAEKPKYVLRNVGVVNPEFSIPPGAGEFGTFATVHLDHNTLIYSMSPHMHLRGRWMKYQALYPSGKMETLLSVPSYDFNWQTIYQFPEPKKLPAGTWILCSGGFDNSSLNPNNPSPEKRITWGEQSFNEMFIGFFDGVELPDTAKN